MEQTKAPLFTRRDLIRLIIPLVIEQILGVTIGMADSVMVSSVGEAAVSGVSLVDSLNILFINIFSALATGGAVIASQYIGRQDLKNACSAAKQLLYITTLIALTVMSAALLFQRPCLSIFGKVDTDVYENCRTYLILSALSYPFLAAYNSGAALFRAMGNSKVSMFTSLLMNLINICGNAITIYGLKWGVAGAAFASLVSRATGAVIMVVLLHNHNNLIHIERLLHPELRLNLIKSILKIGIPNGLENGMFQIGKILVASLVASFGTIAIAANAVANNISSVEVLPGSAIGLAMITVVGRCVGAEDYAQAKKYTGKLMLTTYICMGAICSVMFFLTPTVVGFFHLSEPTMKLAVEVAQSYALWAMAIWPCSFTMPNALRAANDVKFTMIVSIISMWVSRIGLSYVFGKWMNMGLMGVWLAMYCDWIGRTTLFLWRFFSGKWKNRQVI